MNETTKCEICGDTFTKYDDKAEMGAEINPADPSTFKSVICHYGCGQDKGLVLA